MHPKECKGESKELLFFGRWYAEFAVPLACSGFSCKVRELHVDKDALSRCPALCIIIIKGKAEQLASIDWLLPASIPFARIDMNMFRDKAQVYEKWAIPFFFYRFSRGVFCKILPNSVGVMLLGVKSEGFFLKSEGVMPSEGGEGGGGLKIVF